MNTIRSTWVGWGSLCVAGGGAYYFAKKSINRERASRHEEAQRRKEQALAKEQSTKYSRQPAPPPQYTPQPSQPKASSSSSQESQGVADAVRAQSRAVGAGKDDTASPSTEVGHDPAPTRHEPETEAQGVEEKGKYEASEPYRSKRGNRFS
ncbi:hypothetical protein FQN55_001362 [Onygenales sp. PD_40]|nr:hypothetical protein FQN55_001362 [Onygenales sp. PD_40]KAK2807163.1 hypothetical protein FQN51_004777 [Onygenales sp. PD_10]